MSAHRYAIGQTVEFLPGKYSPTAPSGHFTVVRQLPNDGLDREYRVKNLRDGHERVVRESEMRGLEAREADAVIPGRPAAR